MDGLRRITFRFEKDLEVRYLPHVPEVGDRVGHKRELWMVAFVSGDAGGMTIICERPGGNGQHLEHVA